MAPRVHDARAGRHATFQVEVDEFERALHGAAGDLLAAADGHLLAFGDLAVERMQAYCPVGEDGTPDLLNSIDARPGRDEDGFYLDIGTFGVFYSLFVEMGTSQNDAKPFIRPGLEEAVAAWSGA